MQARRGVSSMAWTRGHAMPSHVQDGGAVEQQSGASTTATTKVALPVARMASSRMSAADAVSMYCMYCM